MLPTTIRSSLVRVCAKYMYMHLYSRWYGVSRDGFVRTHSGIILIVRASMTEEEPMYD